ncbi:Cyclin-T like protein [Argiope bruennichi]|uniref:Cyclin-T like protein n=2 Tax=Argiope bruennichi TaxID=94029 RepID=A0A8T0FEA5_ARGBR|nr:Cyclin-T like protein [Argiope bruennichi]
MATTSLHMTTMCLQYKPTIVACVCIHLACKWSSYMIEKCSEGRDWFFYVDKDVTWDLLERLTQEFIEILERSPHRFKRKFGKDGTMHGPKPVDNNPALPGPSGSGSSTNSGASTSNSNRPTAVPVENKIGVVIKKEKDPSPGPPNVEYNSDSKEKKPVVVKKEHDSSKQEEKPQLSLPPPQPSTLSQPSVQAPSHTTLLMPNEQLIVLSNQSVEHPQEKPQPPPPPPLPQPHPQPPPPPATHMPNEHSSSKKSSSKESFESSSSKKHKSKHVSKSKMSISNSSSNHSEPTSSGIKVKIRKDIISLSGVDCNQKYTPPVKAESPKKPLKIKLPKPPPLENTPKVEKSSTPTSLKIVLTKDKSGSGSYSTSHKSEHRESRKRSHSNVTPDGSHRDHKNSVEPSTKYPKVEQYQKNHSSDQRPNKVSRHSSHRSDVDNTHNNASSSRLQYPVNENSTFQNYSSVPNYQNSYLIPPPPLPKLKGHNMMVGKTNSNFPMQPPLPPPQPPPPPPPPEDI